MSRTAELLRARSTMVWMALVVATLWSFWLGTDHGIASAEARSIIIFLVAFLKIRFIGLDFMELREAPTQLRVTFEGFCMLACVVLIGFYLAY